MERTSRPPGASTVLSAAQLFLAGALLFAVVDSGRDGLAFVRRSAILPPEFPRERPDVRRAGRPRVGDRDVRHVSRPRAPRVSAPDAARPGRLAALKMQFQPHFLFNTLNAIAALLKPKPDAAEGMVLQLSDSFRSLSATRGARRSRCARSWSSSSATSRSRKRASGTAFDAFRDPSEVLDARVPNLLLQPLVENAIRHGIAHDVRAGRLEVSATHDRAPPAARLGRRARARLRRHRGIGLTNTRDDSATSSATTSASIRKRPGGGFAISLAFPLVAEPPPGDADAHEPPAAYGF